MSNAIQHVQNNQWAPQNFENFAAQQGGLMGTMYSSPRPSNPFQHSTQMGNSGQFAVNQQLGGFSEIINSVLSFAQNIVGQVLSFASSVAQGSGNSVSSTSSNQSQGGSSTQSSPLGSSLDLGGILKKGFGWLVDNGKPILDKIGGNGLLGKAGDFLGNFGGIGKVAGLISKLF